MKRTLLILSAIFLVIFLMSPAIAQVTLTVTEHQATSESDEQTTPTLGHDAIGDYVVFTSYTPVESGAGAERHLLSASG